MARVVLIEDSEPQRELIAAGLRVAGHEVVEAPTAKDALQTLSRERVDAVVTDIFMPDCDGLELIRMIRAWRRDLPIVAMTAGYSGQSDLFLRIALKLGANIAVRKDDFPRDMAAALDALFVALMPTKEPAGKKDHTFD